LVGRTLGAFSERILRTAACTRGLILFDLAIRFRHPSCTPKDFFNHLILDKSGPTTPSTPPCAAQKGVEKVREAPITRNKASEAKVFQRDEGGNIWSDEPWVLSPNKFSVPPRAPEALFISQIQAGKEGGTRFPRKNAQFSPREPEILEEYFRGRCLREVDFRKRLQDSCEHVRHRGAILPLFSREFRFRDQRVRLWGE
jgi:hypothetical protein